MGRVCKKRGTKIMLDKPDSKKFEGLGSAVGLTPLSPQFEMFASGMIIFQALCRANPFLAPFMPKK